ncbi:DUF2877 domain-containing protein [Jiangella sp. DSM 45060]|uniref:oxamate carbamoyltransferase subunit AllH family protein n=1 Tax=Jiangella sp. DSM 45060 TaxID=1798224 RepID=UPI000879F6A6|nr:DUF2877 domain-containing protein [Jiangella sp. DSM 45060]SDS89580.1 Protein of unknown function [Jiangella sp. DSM 45060]
MPAPTVPTGVRATRPWPGDASRQVLPGAASTAVAALVGGPRLAGEVVAATRTMTAVLVDHGAGPVLLCLTGPAAVRLPCAVVTPWPVSGLRSGERALVGGGELRIGDDDGAVVTVGRWWRVHPAVVADVALARRRAAAQDDHPGLDGAVVAAAGRLGLALLCGDDDELADAAGGLLGLGPGLTPAGDDVLAGALVVGAAVESRGAVRLAAAVEAAGPLHRTTAVSAGLLPYAARGLAVPQLTAYLAALGSARGDVRAAQRGLLAVGHTSGAALQLGVRVALTALAGATR